MEKNDYEVFAKTYKKVEAICIQILEKLAYKPDEGINSEEYVIPLEFPEYESLIVKEDGSVEFGYYESDSFGDPSEFSTLVVPKEVFINENIDEWCESVVAEHKRQIEEQKRQMEARREEDERKLYEKLKKKYGDSSSSYHTK